MVASTGLDFVAIVGDSPIVGIAFEVDVTDSNGSPQSVPKKIWRCLLETPENKCIAKPRMKLIWAYAYLFCLVADILASRRCAKSSGFADRVGLRGFCRALVANPSWNCWRLRSASLSLTSVSSRLDGVLGQRIVALVTKEYVCVLWYSFIYFMNMTC